MRKYFISCRWRGSIYKLVWPDLVIFLLLYYSLNFTYRFALDDRQRKLFEALVQYCESYSDLIPLSFVLGFYVSIVMQRWWNQYVSIPWPDTIAVFVSSNIHGQVILQVALMFQDERGRVMRRTIMRYVCLCLTMIFTMNSPRVKKRFPTLDHFVEAGLLTDNEKHIMNDLNTKFPRHSKHWLPIVWAASIVTRARKEGRIRDDFAVKTIIDELNKFRGQCGLLLSYDSISVPLVYTQVVTLAVYSYFITCVMGRQWVFPDGIDENLQKHRNPIDLYFPIFTTLQFFFYMGWLKVAESLINPFGEDDDDFEVNWLVDRNLQVSYLIVDEMHHEHPELIKDQYWDEVFPSQLPYTVAAEQFRDEQPLPSTANIEIPKSAAEYIAPSSLKIDEMGQYADDVQSGIHFSAGPKRSISRVSTRERMTSAGSASSINTGSLANSLHRVGSVTSVLRRLFSREGPTASSTATQTPATVDGGGPPGRIPMSNSSASLHSKLVGGGSMRIADQVIEEVDEQSTVQSIRPPDQRPNVRTIFPTPTGPPPPSAPVAVPKSSLNIGHLNFPPLSSSAPASAAIPPPTSPAHSSVTYTEILSVKSAPGFGNDNASGLGSASKMGSQDNESTVTIGPPGEGDNVSIGGSSTDSTSEDEFTRLKSKREKERKERLIQRLARSISAQQAAMGMEDQDNEHLLMDLTGSSRTGLLQASPRSGNYGDANV
ncbi:hypothetical protein ANN_07756 [Periplaneta americana]|uniref:Bestrophin homolog n=1 Tax=Periplaneta americana TaxID=6978 RepID=A0ABQ8T062_PERAM|nr:hypothetical protein ANN_07756 [Periplaneta americana]